MSITTSLDALGYVVGDTFAQNHTPGGSVVRYNIKPSSPPGLVQGFTFPGVGMTFPPGNLQTKIVLDPVGAPDYLQGRAFQHDPNGDFDLDSTGTIISIKHPGVYQIDIGLAVFAPTISDSVIVVQLLEYGSPGIFGDRGGICTGYQNARGDISDLTGPTYNSVQYITGTSIVNIIQPRRYQVFIVVRELGQCEITPDSYVSLRHVHC